MKNRSLLYRYIFLLLIPFIITHKCFPQPNSSYYPFIKTVSVIGDKIYGGAGCDGIVRSDNNGVKWSIINNGLNELCIRSIIPAGDKICAATINSFYISTNGGKEWILKNSFKGLNDITLLTVNGNNIFAGTRGNGIFVTSDFGENWKAVNKGLTNLYINDIAVQNSIVIAATAGSGMFFSTDSGDNWTQMNNGLLDPNVKTIAVKQDLIFAGTNSKGIFASTDLGENWYAANEGLASLNVNVIEAGGANIYAGTQNGLFISSDNGGTWRASGSALPDPNVNCIALNKDIIYASSYNGGLFLSSNEGNSWLTLNRKRIDDLTGQPVDTNNIYSSVENNTINEKPVKHSRIGNMLTEFAVGTGMGLGIGLVGAMFGSFAHTTGDTSSSNSESAASTVVILFCVGHGIGNIFGALWYGDKNDGKGSIILGVLGGLIGETGSLLLHTKVKGILTAALYVVSSSILATLGYNLINNGKKEDKEVPDHSSLFQLKSGILSFSIPELLIIPENNSGKLSARCTFFKCAF